MIEPRVAISSLEKYIFNSDYLQKCVTVGNTMYCNGKDVLVRMKGNDTCSENKNLYSFSNDEILQI